MPSFLFDTLDKQINVVRTSGLVYYNLVLFTLSIDIPLQCHLVSLLHLHVGGHLVTSRNKKTFREK